MLCKIAVSTLTFFITLGFLKKINLTSFKKIKGYET